MWNTPQPPPLPPVPVPKQPVGRPTKYTHEMCQAVLEVMGEGLSLTAFAGRIGVARSTINEWMDGNPEFSEACKVGQAKRTEYLERTMLADGIAGPQVTARIFALKNAAPDEWREKQEIENKVSGSVDIEQKPNRELSKLILSLLAKSQAPDET